MMSSFAARMAHYVDLVKGINTGNGASNTNGSGEEGEVRPNVPPSAGPNETEREMQNQLASSTEEMEDSDYATATEEMEEPDYATATEETPPEDTKPCAPTLPHNPIPSSRKRCGDCEGCLREDCGECFECKRKRKFNGDGTSRQACLMRKCLVIKNPKQAGKSWMGRLEEMKEYCKTHPGNLDLKSIKKGEYWDLARWLANQRTKYKQKRLATDRAEELRALGCSGFGANNTNGSGTESEEEEVRPTVAPSTGSNETESASAREEIEKPDKEEQNLDRAQSTGGNRGLEDDKPASSKKSKTMVPTKGLKLVSKNDPNYDINRIDGSHCPPRTNRDTSVTLWNEQYKKLLKIKNERGSFKLRYPQERPICDWVSYQRRLYRRGTLLQCRYDMLNEIGFRWTTATEETPTEDTKLCAPTPEPPQVKKDKAFVSWTERLEEMKEYCKTHPDNLDLRPVVRNGEYWDLARWLANQRTRYKKNRLASDKAESLRALGCSGFGANTNGSGRTNNVSESAGAEAEAGEQSGGDGTSKEDEQPLGVSSRGRRASRSSRATKRRRFSLVEDYE